MSIRVRIAVAFGAVALPALLIVLYSTWRARNDAFLDAMYGAVVERMENDGRAVCEMDPARFERAAARGRKHVPGRLRMPLRGARIYAYDKSFRPALPHAPSFHPDLKHALEHGEIAAFTRQDGGRVDVALRMPWDEGPCAVLLVHTRAGAFNARQQAFVRGLGAALGVLLLALIVALVALGPPLARLRALVQAVRGAPGLEYKTPDGVHGRDEIGAVARALEEANQRVQEHVARLEERDRALRDYVDATTHDLAIPLTVLQSELSDAEHRLRSGNAIDPNALQAALAECQYLAQLVANMDVASRIEAGQPYIERREVDLSAIVERVAARHRPVARHAGAALDYAVPEHPIVVLGDDLLLERALGNLVHNAIRHRVATSSPSDPNESPAHVAIILEATNTNDAPTHFKLTVIDDNPNVTDTLVERLSRSEDPSPTRPNRGRGLGLRIVRAIAEAHGFTLTFARSSEGGLEVRIEGEIQPGALRAQMPLPRSS